MAIFTGVKAEEITDKGIDITTKEGNKVSLAADGIVMATSSAANRLLSDSLKVSELYEAGDCVKSRRILEAIKEGAAAGIKL